MKKKEIAQELQVIVTRATKRLELNQTMVMSHAALVLACRVVRSGYALGLKRGSAPNLTRSEAKYLLKIIRGQTEHGDLVPMQRALKQLRQIAGEPREYQGRKRKGNRP